MANKKHKPDFIIHAGQWATVWGFEPLTRKAKSALKHINAEDWQWQGGKLYADHRPARALARHLSDLGLTLLHPEYGYFVAQ